MKFLKGLLLVISVIAYCASSAVFILSYSVLSSAGPSLVMEAIDVAGGAEKVVDEVLRQVLADLPLDRQERAALTAAAKAALTPETIRDLTDQAISGFRRYLDSGGSDTSVTLSLRALKTSFFNELKKAYPQAVGELEKMMKQIPDTVNISHLLPASEVKEIARPYKMAAGVPTVAATVAVASCLLICLAAGWRRGLVIAGWSLVAVSAAVFSATFVGASEIKTRLPKLLQGVKAAALPLKVDLVSLVGHLSGFVLARARLISGMGAGAGLVLLLLPVLFERRQSATKQV